MSRGIWVLIGIIADCAGRTAFRMIMSGNPLQEAIGGTALACLGAGLMLMLIP